MRPYPARLLLSAMFALIAELLYAAYTLSLVGGAVTAAAVLSFVLPFVCLMGTVWCVEERRWLRRLGLVAAAATGYAVGTVAVMMWWPA